MGNQWVQSHSSLRKTLKRVNAACDKFRECGYGFVHLPMLSLFNPVAVWIWIILSVGRIGASFIPLHARTCMCLSHVSSHVFFLNLPLSTRKLWPYSAVYGISCLKNRPSPCSTVSSTLWCAIWNVMGGHNVKMTPYVCATEVKSQCFEGILGACWISKMNTSSDN